VQADPHADPLDTKLMEKHCCRLGFLLNSVLRRARGAHILCAASQPQFALLLGMCSCGPMKPTWTLRVVPDCRRRSRYGRKGSPSLCDLQVREHLDPSPELSSADTGRLRVDRMLLRTVSLSLIESFFDVAGHDHGEVPALHHSQNPALPGSSRRRRVLAGRAKWCSPRPPQ